VHLGYRSGDYHGCARRAVEGDGRSQSAKAPASRSGASRLASLRPHSSHASGLGRVGCGSTGAVMSGPVSTGLDRQLPVQCGESREAILAVVQNAVVVSAP
jgi:hypothetical protein